MPNRKTALITGATGGLGVQLCKEFAAHGFDLVITARNPQRLGDFAAMLREVYRIRVKVIVADLNQENAAKVVYQKVTAAGLTVDVLVNNAGFGLGGCFHRGRPNLHDAMIRVNVTTPTRLCRMFLPGMLERGRGAVLNVASTGSFVPGPYNAVYCATKAYVLSLTEALAHELRATPIRVAAVAPGAMHTGFARRAGMESTRLFNYGVMPTRLTARTAYRALERRKPVAVAGGLNKAMIASLRLVPRRAATAVSAMMQKPRLV